MFQELGFINNVYRNLTASEMREVFTETASMYAEEAYCNGCPFTVFAACVLTKGGERSKEFYGAENTTMEMREFFEIVDKIPSLQSKPKLVIFQSFQGKGIANSFKFVDSFFITLYLLQM